MLNNIAKSFTVRQQQEFVQQATGGHLSWSTITRLFAELDTVSPGSSRGAESFQCLADFNRQVADMQPGSHLETEWDEQDMGPDGTALRFKAQYMVLGPSVSYCNAVGVNMAQLDAGWISGHILNGWRLAIVCVRTGSRHILPVSISISASESAANLGHLLKFMLQHGLSCSFLQRLPGEPPLMFLRDGVAANQKALTDVLPEAEQRECLLHLSRLLRRGAGSLGSAVVSLFWGAAHSTRSEDTDAFLDKIKNIHRPSYEKLMALGKHSWAVSGLGEIEDDAVSADNDVEILQGVFQDARVQGDILYLLDSVLQYTDRTIQRMYDAAVLKLDSSPLSTEHGWLHEKVRQRARKVAALAQTLHVETIKKGHVYRVKTSSVDPTIRDDVLAAYTRARREGMPAVSEIQDTFSAAHFDVFQRVEPRLHLCTCTKWRRRGEPCLCGHAVLQHMSQESDSDLPQEVFDPNSKAHAEYWYHPKALAEPEKLVFQHHVGTYLPPATAQLRKDPTHLPPLNKGFPVRALTKSISEGEFVCEDEAGLERVRKVLEEAGAIHEKHYCIPVSEMEGNFMQKREQLMQSLGLALEVLDSRVTKPRTSRYASSGDPNVGRAMSAALSKIRSGRPYACSKCKGVDHSAPSCLFGLDPSVYEAKVQQWIERNGPMAQFYSKHPMPTDSVNKLATFLPSREQLRYLVSLYRMSSVSHTGAADGKASESPRISQGARVAAAQRARTRGPAAEAFGGGGAGGGATSEARDRAGAGAEASAGVAGHGADGEGSNTGAPSRVVEASMDEILRELPPPLQRLVATSRAAPGFTFNPNRGDFQHLGPPGVYVPGGLYAAIVRAKAAALLESPVMRATFIRQPEDMCGQHLQHFEAIWQRLYAGLTLQEVWRRYGHGFYDAVPPAVNGKYFLPLDIRGHGWVHIKDAMLRRETHAFEQGIASVFHIRQALYGELVPTCARKGKAAGRRGSNGSDYGGGGDGSRAGTRGARARAPSNAGVGGDGVSAGGSGAAASVPMPAAAFGGPTFPPYGAFPGMHAMYSGIPFAGAQAPPQPHEMQALHMLQEILRNSATVPGRQ